MSRGIILVFLAACAVAAANPGFGQNPVPAARPDPLPALLEKLREPVDFNNAEGQIGLRDLMTFAAGRLGVPVIIGPDLAASVPIDDANQVMLKTNPGKLSLGKSLNAVLGQQAYTFLVRKDHLEIVTLETAATESRMNQEENAPTNRLPVPLVSVVLKEKPLNEAVAEISEDCDMTVIVTPQAGDAKTAFVSARMLNVPFHKALELLAIQADLRVLTRGNAYVITSQDHANTIFNDKLEREKQQAELERLKLSPLGGGLGTPPPEKEKENKE